MHHFFGRYFGQQIFQRAAGKSMVYFLPCIAVDLNIGLNYHKSLFIQTLFSSGLSSKSSSFVIKVFFRYFCFCQILNFAPSYCQYYGTERCSKKEKVLVVFSFLSQRAPYFRLGLFTFLLEVKTRARKNCPDGGGCPSSASLPTCGPTRAASSSWIILKIKMAK